MMYITLYINCVYCVYITSIPCVLLVIYYILVTDIWHIQLLFSSVSVCEGILRIFPVLVEYAWLQSAFTSLFFLFPYT